MSKLTITIAVAILLSGCGGTKLLKEPEPLAITQSLSTVSDNSLATTLDWIIYRDGPGTWAKNVDWDEYMIGVQNMSGESLRITNIMVVDSLGTSIESRQDRKALVKGSKATKRRYKGEGLKVKAGLSGKVLLGAGAVAAAGTTGLSSAAMLGSTSMAGAAAIVALVPVLAVGGVVRGVNNSKVNGEIESRQTLLPVVLEHDERTNLVLFFPLSPSPQRIEISYIVSQGERTLVMDTQAALDGLHLMQAEE